MQWTLDAVMASRIAWNMDGWKPPETSEQKWKIKDMKSGNYSCLCLKSYERCLSIIIGPIDKCY